MGNAITLWGTLLARRTVVLATSLVLVLVAAPTQIARAAEAYELSEDRESVKAFQVTTQLTVNGELETATGKGSSVTLKLEVEATQQYLERKLAGAGRDAEGLRSLRERSIEFACSST